MRSIFKNLIGFFKFVTRTILVFYYCYYFIFKIYFKYKFIQYTKNYYTILKYNAYKIKLQTLLLTLKILLN